MTDIDKLFMRADEIVSYPNSMKKIGGEVKVVAFFPGGKGLINLNDHTISNKSIMVVGQDFDTLKNYNNLVNNGREDIHKNKTWDNLLRLFEVVGINADHCFFTNAILGARIDSRSTGKSPAFESRQFIKDCQSFFLYQLSVQKPELILVLGIQTARFLADISIELMNWRNFKTIMEIDECDEQFVFATFQNGYKCKIVLLSHPSFRKLNVKNRIFKGLSGEEAEIELIRTALQYQTTE